MLRIHIPAADTYTVINNSELHFHNRIILEEKSDESGFIRCDEMLNQKHPPKRNFAPNGANLTKHYIFSRSLFYDALLNFRIQIDLSTGGGGFTGEHYLR